MNSRLLEIDSEGGRGWSSSQIEQRADSDNFASIQGVNSFSTNMAKFSIDCHFSITFSCSEAVYTQALGAAGDRSAQEKVLQQIEEVTLTD